MKQTSLFDIAAKIDAHTAAAANNKLATGAAVDSRLLKPGDLFFALPGEHVDGHDFLADAAASGASGAVVGNHYQGPDYGMPLLRVADTLQALQQLARTFLQSSKASVVAVTGSLGKTTVKGFITSLLSHKFKVASSPGNSNSQIGLPLAILNHTSANDDIIVLEMGMTLPGQIGKLIEIARPEVAVVTKVALVHAENFDSIEEIAQAKAEIFTSPTTKLGFYHYESNFGGILTAEGECLKRSFSMEDSQADSFLSVVDGDMHIYETGQFSGRLPLLSIPGAHNRHNYLAAINVARYFGMTWEEIRAAQASLELPERRLQFTEKFGALFVNDAYNASELSMIAAFNSLPDPKPGSKRIAFLGGIVELGKFSEGCHRAVGKYALDHVDIMLCFGTDCLPIVEEWQSAGRHVVWAAERKELMPALRQQLQNGDVVLLKGSRAKGVWKVLEEL